MTCLATAAVKACAERIMKNSAYERLRHMR